MRLVSMFGITDIPYENAQLFLDGSCVRAIFSGRDYLMAKYSTADKAMRSMEMVRDAYCSLPVVLKNSEVSEEVIEMLKKKSVICAYTADKDGSIEYINNAVFQFPKDEELEI